VFGEGEGERMMSSSEDEAEESVRGSLERLRGEMVVDGAERRLEAEAEVEVEVEVEGVCFEA